MDELYDESAFEQPAENQPPYAMEARASAEVGEMLDLWVEPRDPDGDTVTVTFEDLPSGASFLPGSNEIVWTPSESDVGAHRFTVVLSDGTHTARVPGRIDVTAAKWEGALLPGISWTTSSVGIHADLDEGTPGPALLRGPMFQLALWGGGDPDRDDGPSRARVYVNLGLMELMPVSNALRTTTILRYGAGFDGSLESRAARRWFLPSYGIEIEGLRMGESDVPSIARIQPHFGMYLHDGPALSLHAACGYGYALRQVAAWSGAECSVSAQRGGW